MHEYQVQCLPFYRLGHAFYKLMVGQILTSYFAYPNYHSLLKRKPVQPCAHTLTFSSKSAFHLIEIKLGELNLFCASGAFQLALGQSLNGY